MGLLRANYRTPYKRMTATPIPDDRTLWEVARISGMLGLITLVVLLFIAPEPTLEYFWNLAVPAIPVVLFPKSGHLAQRLPAVVAEPGKYGWEDN